MMNTLTVAELKQRGMAAIENRLQAGSVYIMKRNQPAAVVMSIQEYHDLTRQQKKQVSPAPSQALAWLLNHTPTGVSEKSELDARIQSERDSWNSV